MLYNPATAAVLIYTVSSAARARLICPQQFSPSKFSCFAVTFTWVSQTEHAVGSAAPADVVLSLLMGR